NAHDIALYILDWEPTGRTQTIEMRDGDTDALLDTRSSNDFVNGKYFVWTISGHIKIKVIRNGGPNTVLSGIFFGPATGDNPPYLDMRSPDADETAVDPATDVRLHIKDDETGVDLASVVVTVAGTGNVVYDGSNPSAYPEVVVSGTSADYLLVYTPPAPFDFDQLVEVTVMAADLSANTLMDSYSFTIRSPGVDLLELGKQKILMEMEPLTALDLFNQVLAVDPTNPAAIFWRAITLPMESPALQDVLEDIGFWDSGTGKLDYHAHTSTVFTLSLLPNTTELVAACAEVLTYIEMSLSELAQLDTSFMDTFTVTAGTGDYMFDLDYAEVKIVENAFFALKVIANIKVAYNVENISLNQLITQQSDLIDLLTANPNLFALTVNTAARLSDAQTAFINALMAYMEASDFIRNQRDDNDGLNHLVRLYDPYIPEMYNSFAEWQAMKDEALTTEAVVHTLLEDIKTNLEGGAPFVIDFEALEMIGFDNITPSLQMDTLTVDLDEFFSTPKDMRNFLTELAGNDFVFDDFADPTLSGVFPGLTPADWNNIIVAEPRIFAAYLFEFGGTREGQIYWERVDPDFDSAFVHYELYRSDTSTVDTSSTLMATITDPNVTEFADTTVGYITPGYYYRLYAHYDFGAGVTGTTYGNKELLFIYLGP
ncbi:MAG: hypothetical protein K8I00_04065, partial [Candidatus Omnitrophica bacterium]|nr:hypothetical protein [Candidatus Omnitrophota bacterium]